jgi:hypothetical protein
VRPETEDGKYVAGEAEFVRTGLLGFLGPGGLVFVCGSRDGLMNVSGRKHNTDDIIATVLAVEPMRWAHVCEYVTSGTRGNTSLPARVVARHFRHMCENVTSGTCENVTSGTCENVTSGTWENVTTGTCGCASLPVTVHLFCEI